MTPDDGLYFGAALAAAAEVFAEPMSSTRIEGYFTALRDLSLEAVERALGRAIAEWRSGGGRPNFPRPGDLRDFLLPRDDGHPGPEEAWALVAHLDDRATVVWTDAIARAWGVAAEVLPDRVAARMAFTEVYRRELVEARERGETAQWWASLGWDPKQRSVPIMDAVRGGRLPLAQAQQMLRPEDAEQLRALMGKMPAALPLGDGPSAADVQALVATLTEQRHAHPEQLPGRGDE